MCLGGDLKRGVALVCLCVAYESSNLARPRTGGTIVDAHALKRATHVLAERLPHGKRESAPRRVPVLHPQWVVRSVAARYPPIGLI